MALVVAKNGAAAEEYIIKPTANTPAVDYSVDWPLLLKNYNDR